MQNTVRHKKIIEKLETINTYLSSKKLSGDNNISLTSGITGVCLYFYEYNAYIKGLSSKKRFTQALSRSYKIVQLSDVLETSFSAGISGWGWLIAHTKKKGDVNDNLNNEIDAVLDEQLDVFLSTNNYDFLHGAIGIGVYFLKREQPARIKKIVQALYDNCIDENDEVKWKRFDQFNYHADLYDFGFAHGVAGILAFLLKCHEKGICCNLIEGLLKKGFNFYINNIQSENYNACIFPNKVLITNYKKSGVAPTAKMQGWCYGDLATCLALLKIARLFNNKADEKTIIELLHRIAKRRSLDKNRVIDAGFCHGASGIAYLYLKICCLIKDNMMEKELQYWINLLISPHAIKGNCFEFYLGHKYGWGEVAGLLNGTAGVGLVLLAYLNRDNQFNPGWGECLML